MSCIIVIEHSVMTTVQDLGRLGFRALGVASCGACDQLSLRIANRLLGNHDSAAALELTAIAPVALRCPDDIMIAITGASMPTLIEHVDGSKHDALLWRPIRIARGSTLRFQPASTGLRTYVAVQGGITIAPTLSSRATHVPSAIGGINGRRLAVGDQLPIGTPRQSPSLSIWEHSIAYPLISSLTRRTIRATHGAHTDAFDNTGRATFQQAEYRVTSQTDRMGVRLHGEPLHNRIIGNMPTEGMPIGAIQVPQDGQPIILLHDGPPTGGYPIIASVITADLPAIAQRRSGDQLRFQLVDLDEARSIHLEQEHLLNQLLPRAADDAHSGKIDLNCDLGEDPAPIASGRDAAIIALVSSVNVACGGHTGDEQTMRAIVETAAKHGVAVGAHPSFPDRANFGRLHMNLSTATLRASIEQQLKALQTICEAVGVRITHVKPHGALYHAADSDAEVAGAIAEATTVLKHPVALVGRAYGAAIDRWSRRGHHCIREAFADRAYQRDGTLLPRRNTEAVIDDPDTAAAQALAIAQRRPFPCIDGSLIFIEADTICIHSDSPNALETAQAIRRAIKGQRSDADF